MKPPGVSAASSGPQGVGWAVGASVAAHGVALAVIVWGWGASPPADGVPVMDVELVVAASVEPGQGAGQAARPATPQTPSPTPPAPRVDTPAQVVPPPSSVEPEPAAVAPASDTARDIAIVLPDPAPPPEVHPQDWRARQTPPSPSPPEPAARAQPAPSTSVKAPPPSSAASPPPTRASPLPTSSTPPNPDPPSPPPPPSQARSAPAPTRAPQQAASTPAAGDTPLQGSTAVGARAGNDGARLVRHIAPTYPPLARERGQEGRVVVRLVIGADGVPADIRVAESSGIAALDAAALDAVRQWRFAPARRAGAPIAEERLAPVVFRLRH